MENTECPNTGPRVEMLAQPAYKPPTNLSSTSKASLFIRKLITWCKQVWYPAGKNLGTGPLCLTHNSWNQQKPVEAALPTAWGTKCWHSADSFLGNQKCTLRQEGLVKLFPSTAQLKRTKANPFFNASQLFQPRRLLRYSLQQAAQASGGVSIPGSVQKPCRHGTSGHGLVGVVVLTVGLDDLTGLFQP